MEFAVLYLSLVGFLCVLFILADVKVRLIRTNSLINKIIEKLEEMKK